MPDSLGERIYYRLPFWMQNLVFSYHGLQLRRMRYNKYFHRFLEELRESEWWTKEAIREYQNQKLRELLKHANETVPFYREWFGDHGVRVEAIKTLDDLPALPILTKQIVRENQSRMISSLFHKQRLLKFLTSGTTGTPLEIAITPEALAFQWAVWWRHRARFGLRLQDRCLMFGARVPISQNQHRPPFWRHDFANRRTYLSTYHLTKENMSAVVDYLNTTRYDFFAGYPSAMVVLANHILNTGQRLTNHPKIVVSGSDTLYEHFKSRITEAFGAPVTEQYGMREFAGNLSECEKGHLHVDFECCHIETEPIATLPGFDNLLLTGWGNPAMPFIRYQIGDLVKSSSGSCTCGRSSACFDSVIGRSEDYVATPDGRLLMGMNQVFEYASGADEIQIYQKDVHSIELRIVPGPNFSEADKAALTRELRRRIGNDMRIEFTLVDSIPRASSCKFKAVVSEIEIPRPAQPTESDVSEKHNRMNVLITDYKARSFGFRLRKTLRYVRLYGIPRTIMKIRGQYHMSRRYDILPALAAPSSIAHVGMLGCGNFAFSNIAYYLNKNYGRVIRGTMDVDLHRAASLAKAFRAGYYTDKSEEVISDKNIDLLFIASNHASHTEYAIAGLQQGKAVHIEKPHAVNRNQLVRLCRAIKECNGKVTLGFNRPSSRLNRIIAEQLQKETGPAMLNWFVAGHEIPRDHWYFNQGEGGRVLGNMCHWIDFVYHLVPPETRYPITIYPAPSHKSADDIAVTYVFGDGTMAAITFSAKSYMFEGVRERFAAHKGNTLIAMEDFQKLTIEIMAKKRHVSLWFRDHGHQQTICRSYSMVRPKNAPSNGSPLVYIWETGELSLRTKEAIEEKRVITVDAYSEDYLN